MTEAGVVLDPEGVREFVAGIRWRLLTHGNTAALGSGPYAVEAARVVVDAGEARRNGRRLVVISPDPPLDPGEARTARAWWEAMRTLLFDVAAAPDHRTPRRRLTELITQAGIPPAVMAAAIRHLRSIGLVTVDPDGTVRARYPDQAPKIKEWPRELTDHGIHPPDGSTAVEVVEDSSLTIDQGDDLRQLLTDRHGDRSTDESDGGLSAGSDEGSVGDVTDIVAGDPGDDRARRASMSTTTPLDETTDVAGDQPGTSAAGPSDDVADVTADQSPRSITPTARPPGFWGTDADLLHRTRRRTLVALQVEGGTAKASRITSGYLAKPQRRMRDVALRELVAAGAVREIYPRSPRQHAYRIVDSTLGGFTAAEIDAEATRIREQRAGR